MPVEPCPKCGYCATATVTASWELHIPREVGSLNDRHVNMGYARFAYKRLRNEWQLHLRVARANHKVPPAERKRRVTITRVYSGRQRQIDRDNLIGAAKPCVDAMVNEKLIIGDSPSQAEIHYLQIKCAKSETIVLIEELG